ncbi:formin-like protein 20 [Brachypodium distachyon]|uniref:Uncharacterized protein n=1 Tax=Brachypodium distachyon TaxID=15368 RepID=I1H9H9_BRADI|nr:formin-like protein 20 [Brachypodium distachyon]XP_010229172.1 formin-like protein 20 [Brachypodium distachyon]XP_024310614.1 formin-like protein 20 [Brachypodium distachyon]KQK23538.1 hypothetical protein BRADI_1g74470v3 [Brachypodium distachyon]KQK23539.1 hypothetical protein BRADI_1g74470v3 [Brachypodium distachyon]PNT78151.1 hypothetical protein BRADI_1g74470v3 [Brachypodium distachyon]PNT78152.1 hypothetical protein BRADI_1g74470v3 [Brachypodium distachyon]|eukprot:XP_003558769.1 formin-like protein 20 [Brachypodium distachyon]
METLVISQQRSHHHHSGRRRKPSSHFSSPQSMRGYNCRAFHSTVSIGILRSPPPPPPTAPARTRSSPEPKTPKQQQLGKKRSRVIPITPSGSPPSRPELWAGPAYSNSPPPSSLPIPKFSLHQKRSVSLELPPTGPSVHVEVLVHAKSAPSTPTAGSGSDFFGNDTAIATENLRRILNLEIADH